MRLFFATDLHGSEVCFRKFVAAADFYGCEALILGGDLSGKLLVALSRSGDSVVCHLGGQEHHVSATELEPTIRRIADMGYYPVLADAEEADALKGAAEYERRLLEETIKRLRSWVSYADERLGETGIPILVAPGNDDDLAIDEAFL